MPRDEPVITATFPSRSNSFTAPPPKAHTAMVVPVAANLRLALALLVVFWVGAASADAPPMPPEATTRHHAGSLAYTAKAAVLELKGEKTARIFHITYTLDD